MAAHIPTVAVPVGGMPKWGVAPGNGRKRLCVTSAPANAPQTQ